MRTIMRPGVVLLAALALVLVGAGAFMARLDGASAAGGGPEMRLTANGCTADCTFATGESLTLAVEIVTAPEAGYVAVQSFIDYGDNLIYDIDGQAAADEVIWPDCEGLTAVRAQTTGPEVVNHGCLTGLLPPQPVSTYVGNFVEISLTCSSGNSTTQVQLLTGGELTERDPGAITSGTAFFAPDDVVPAKVSNLSITCGAGGPLDTPTSTATQRPTQTLTPTPSSTPSMRLTANGCAADCTFANNESFTLAVEIVTAPTAGYVLAQTFIDYGDDLIYDIDGQPAADEIVWADLEPIMAVRSSLGTGLVNHGGLSGLIPPLPVSTYTGNFVEIMMTCSAGDTSTQVDLLPLGDQQTVTSGAAFVEGDSVTRVTPKVSGLLIHCGAGGPLDTPTPTGTQTPPPTPTVTPMPALTPMLTQPPSFSAASTPTAGGPADVIFTIASIIALPSTGDGTCSNTFDAIDATLILQLHARLIPPLLCPRDSDVNDDGRTDSVDAALVIQHSAGYLPTLPP